MGFNCCGILGVCCLGCKGFDLMVDLLSAVFVVWEKCIVHVGAVFIVDFLCYDVFVSFQCSKGVLGGIQSDDLGVKGVGFCGVIVFFVVLGYYVIVVF